MAAIRVGSVVAREAAVAFGVSEDSIRRDLRDLAAEGRCRKVYGGAVRVPLAEGDLTARRAIAPDGKAAVARLAAGLIAEGAVVMLDGGTTAHEVARALPADLACTIVTPSPTVAVALADRRRVEVRLLGGLLFRHSMVTVGAETAEAARRVRADLALIGVTGVHADHGLTTGDAEDAAIKRVLAEQSAETVVLATAEKLGAVSPHQVLALPDADLILTDGSPEDPVARELVRAGASLRFASA